MSFVSSSEFFSISSLNLNSILALVIGGVSAHSGKAFDATFIAAFTSDFDAKLTFA